MASIASEVIREIRENPEVREEVRRLILTDELLAMPALLARVDTRQDQMAALLVQQGERLDRVDARQDRMEETQAQMAALLARMDARQDRTEARQDRTEEARQDRMEETQGRMDARQDRMEETQAQIVELLARMDARQDRMEDDLGGIKGSVVEARAQRRMMSLAPARLGLRNAEVVVGPAAPSEALERFSDACRNAGASAEQLDRLVKTDLIIRAQKGAGDDSRRVYLAVEVAYRLDEEDIGRVSESMAVLSDLAARGRLNLTLRSWAPSMGSESTSWIRGWQWAEASQCSRRSCRSRGNPINSRRYFAGPRRTVRGLSFGGGVRVDNRKALLTTGGPSSGICGLLNLH